MVCPESLIFHVDDTSYPPYVAVEWDDAVPGVDWRAFLTDRGYQEVAATAQLTLWTLTGTAPDPVECPSWEDLRRRLVAEIPGRSRT